MTQAPRINRSLWLGCAIASSLACAAAQADAPRPPSAERANASPTHRDVRYGKHPRNRLDLWLAESDRPTPLVIYIHGGGFRNGDKSGLRRHHERIVRPLLERGISVAAINYRFIDKKRKVTILDCMHDGKRAVQFLRHRAAEWNLDKPRVACMGGSAGAGMSLWLAFHDDMAEPDSSDPVLRESTRLAACVAQGTQSTYDFSRWGKLLNIRGKPDRNANTPSNRELDMLAMMSRDDPPFLAANRLPNTPLHYDTLAQNKESLYHHPLHVKALKDRAEEVGVTHVCRAPAIGLNAEADPIEFLIRHLGPDN